MPVRTAPVDRASDRTVFRLRESLPQYPFGSPKALGSIDVNPGVIPYIEGADRSTTSQPPEPSGEGVIAVSGAGLEGRKDRRPASEEAGVVRVVVRQLLADLNNTLLLDQEFRRVVRVNHCRPVEPEISGNNDAVPLRTFPD